MNFIAVDLGSTNVKAGLFDSAMHCSDYKSTEVKYCYDNSFVEFDAEQYAIQVLDLIRSLDSRDAAQIVFTGQAETLVILGKNGKPLMNAISWMDARSAEECDEVLGSFSLKECYEATGQQAVLPTWPATKIMWLRKHRPEVFCNAECYMLLKDYVVYCLTSRKTADKSIATFSFYFDIFHGCYWKKMLDFIGISESQLPPLSEPCTVAGTLNENASGISGLPSTVKVNIGTLDHFAGMIGVGNVREGVVSYSTGTVMALATIASKSVGSSCTVALHYGFIPGTLVMLPVAESGGVCLQWYRDRFMKGVSFKDIDIELSKRHESLPNDVLFLPYIVGTNAPEFDKDAQGAFFGLRFGSDEYDLAYAVMEGVAHLLKKNCDEIERNHTRIEYIIATGGGAKSAIWCQLQASLAGVPVKVPEEKEAGCLGSAIIGAVSEGVFRSFEEASGIVRFSKTYMPEKSEKLQLKHRQFNELYRSALKIKEMN
ncbi:MAG: FGGY family carbohydrate kinase [Candidatus Cloacimonetes bacterium]|nr:FGGY family carbohydrate kinase [Candidatus Cloacimonadota bacterium]